MKRTGTMYDGVQLPRTKVPKWVYEAMTLEANKTGVSMADIVRWELAGRYATLQATHVADAKNAEPDESLG